MAEVCTGCNASSKEVRLYRYGGAVAMQGLYREPGIRSGSLPQLRGGCS